MKQTEPHPATSLTEEPSRVPRESKPEFPTQDPRSRAKLPNAVTVEHHEVRESPTGTVSPTKPVAVIAVHGVGYCDRFATARHIASLLLGLGRLRLREGVPWPDGGKGTPQPYPSCVEEFIQIPLERVHVSDANAQARLVTEEPVGASFGLKMWIRVRRLFHFYAESRGHLAEVFARRRDPEEAEKEVCEDKNLLGRKFMASQLAGYVSTQDGQAWDTIRLRAERAAPADGSPRKVDIYECYWADLTRPQGSIVSFFTALYQLLFHLASLSRTALEYAAVEHIKRFRWRVACFFQAMAVRLLVIFIPILNLLLLITGLTVLPLNIGLNHQYLSAALFGFLVFLGLLFRPHRVPNHFRSWLLMLAVAYLLGLVLASLPIAMVNKKARAGDIALAVEWWILGELVLLQVMRRYDAVRRGAFATAVFLGLACVVVYFRFVIHLTLDEVSIPVEQASFWTMEVIFSVLALCWGAVLAFALGTWAVHLWCLAPLHTQARRSKKKQPAGSSTPELAAYARARAAFRTARLTLAVSASMISLVTVFLWAGAFAYTNKSFNLLAGVNIDYPPSPFRSLTTLIIPREFRARWLVRKADPDRDRAKEVNCGENSPDADNHCEAGTDAPADGSECIKLSAKDQETLQNRLGKVQQVLVANASLASVTPGDLEGRTGALEKAAGIKHDRTYGCVYRVYLLENKVGIAGHTEFNVLARVLLLGSTSSGMPLMITLIVLAIVVLGWAVARSLIPDGTALNLANNRQCMQLADWLSRGLDSTRAVTSLFWHSIFTVPVIFVLLDHSYSGGYLSAYVARHAWMRTGLDTFIATSLILLDSVGRKLALSGAAIAAIIYRYGRAPLDIVLDVDNYLRTSPLENAPRARIAERYVSLLRYIAARKDRQDPKHPYYGSVVIVAHSLGALISADLLHFLKEEPDEALRPLGYGEKNQAGADIQIRLLTFGNPLRQLLNRFFSHLYWWVRDEPDNGARPMVKAGATPPDLTHLPDTPKVSDLGSAVKHWFNAYRSGDFVGRMLWSDHWYSRNAKGPKAGQFPQEVKVNSATDPADNTKRSEMCIGLGGHNDYWNRTAPDMAQQLDTLIQM